MASDDFLNASEAARLLMVDRHRVPELVEAGLLSARALPVRRKYRRDEVEALAAAMIRKGGATS